MGERGEEWESENEAKRGRIKAHLMEREHFVEAFGFYGNWRRGLVFVVGTMSVGAIVGVIMESSGSSGLGGFFVGATLAFLFLLYRLYIP